MLAYLDELLDGKAGPITFNGRSFDVPLLDNRYLMNRRLGRLPAMPHIDLLPPARRLYRSRLGSCALGALEQNLLGLRRTQDDVPGPGRLFPLPELSTQRRRHGVGPRLLPQRDGHAVDGHAGRAHLPPVVRLAL